MNFPLAIFMMFMIAITLILRWRSTDKNELLRLTAIHLVISGAAAAVIAFAAGMSSIYFIIYTLTACFLISTNVSTIMKSLKINYLVTGGQIAHIGVGIFLLGVLLSGNFSSSEQLTLPKGKEVKALNHTFLFTGYNRIMGSDKYSFDVQIKSGKKTFKASPVMFISSFNNSLMREPDILPGWGKDIYISPVGYDENAVKVGGFGDSGEVLTIEASIKQNMDLVWSGVILITAGLVIASFRRKRENKILSSNS